MALSVMVQYPIPASRAVAVVGAVRLLTNEHQLAVEVSVAQRLGRTQTRERSANDDDDAAC